MICRRCRNDPGNDAVGVGVVVVVGVVVGVVVVVVVVVAVGVAVAVGMNTVMVAPVPPALPLQYPFINTRLIEGVYVPEGMMQ